MKKAQTEQSCSSCGGVESDDWSLGQDAVVLVPDSVSRYTQELRVCSCPQAEWAWLAANPASQQA